MKKQKQHAQRVFALLAGLIVLCFLSATPASAQVCAAYVGNEGSGTVSVIDTAKALVDPTNSVTVTITVGTHPDVGAITPDGAFAYVANGASCDVSVIDTATNTVKSTIAVGCGATDVAITPDGTFAYVTNNASSSVSVIDTAKALTDPTNAVLTTISSLAGGVEDVAISPDGAFAYVTTGVNVTVISTATNTVTRTIPIPSANPFGSHNVGIAFTPDGAFAYVASRHNNNVAVIDTAKALTDPATALVSTIPVGSGPNGLAITSNGAFVYVANVNSNNVSVINTATNSVIATIAVGQTPAGVAITLDGAFAYVTNNASSSVSVIDTAKALTDPANAVTATVLVGFSPYHLAIACPPSSGQAILSVTPDSLDFGNVIVGAAVDLPFTIQNIGAGTLTGSATTTAPFSIVSGGSFSLGAGQNQTVTVRFSPSAIATFVGSANVTSNGGNATVNLSGTGVPLPVNIDIKPGSFPNSINLGSGGTVPVAILSTATFDARTVDPTTVTLASAPVQLKGKGTPMASFEDMNGDGLLDQVVHVSTEALQLSETDTGAVLEGKTTNGTPIRGTDSVRVVP